MAVTVNSGQTNTVTANYVVLGSLQVTINPAGAVSAGAQWQVDGGAWQNSGNVVSNLATGAHTIGYLAVTGYITPTNQTLNINPGGTTNIVATYVALGAVSILINPTNAVTSTASLISSSLVVLDDRVELPFAAVRTNARHFFLLSVLRWLSCHRQPSFLKKLGTTVPDGRPIRWANDVIISTKGRRLKAAIGEQVFTTAQSGAEHETGKHQD